MTDQVALTLLAPVRPDGADALRQVLAQMSKDPGGNPVIPLGKLTGVHFARLLLLEATQDLRGSPIPANLIWMSDADAPLERHLEQLLEVAGEGLDQVFGACEGYPEPGRRDLAQRRAYLRAHIIPNQAVYVNTIGRTVAQVRQEDRLRDALEGFLDRVRGQWSGWDAATAREAIRRYVDDDPALRWARRPVPPPPLGWRIRQALDFAGLPLVIFLLSPVLLPAFPLWLWLLRRHEQADPAPHVAPDPAHEQALADLEDWGPQNQFSAVGFLKPGWFRLITTLAVLRLVGFGAHHLFNRGNLAGVKTIHFARWVMLNDRRRVIFASNYDGSLESYMDDFIDKVYWGLNAVFSNGFGYPKTRWLLFGGAQDEQAFKDFLRVHQVPTQVWFSAYPQLTARNLDNNARIRQGLSGTMDAAAARQWLKRL
jgi:hypothetical protein